MAKINMAIPHRLSQEEALKRVQALLSGVKSQFADKISGLREEWTGNLGEFSFSVMGMPVAGSLTVGVFEIKLSGEIPFAALFFKSKIESAIRDQAETLLA